MTELKSRPLKISLSQTDLNGKYGDDVEFTADLSTVKDVITGAVGAIGPENCLKLGGGAAAATALYVLVRSIKKNWPWLETTNVEMDVLEVSVPPKKEEKFTNLMEKNVLERRLVQDFENLDTNLEGILGEETFDQCGEAVLSLLKDIRIKSIDQSIAASGLPENMAAGRIIKGRRNVKEYGTRMAVFDKSEAKGIVTAEFIGKDAVVEGEVHGGMVAVGKGYDGNEATALVKGVYGKLIEVRIIGNQLDRAFQQQFEPTATIWDVSKELIAQTRKQLPNIVRVEIKRNEEPLSETLTMAQAQMDGSTMNWMARFEE